jgi:multiple sugar transport system ATP-binding protein
LSIRGIRKRFGLVGQWRGHSCLDAVIDVLEPTGADTMAVASVHGHPVTARLKPGAVRDVGRSVRLAVDMNRASLFDPATELRIA